MLLMKRNVLLVLAILFGGCYDLGDGSTPEVFENSLGGENGDIQSGDPCTEDAIMSASAAANGTIGVISRSERCVEGKASVTEQVRPSEVLWMRN